MAQTATTQFAAIAGWLFWMKDDDGVPGMTIPRWLGTALAVLLVGLVLWRWWFFKSNSQPSFFYLLVTPAVIYQGRLGHDQSFVFHVRCRPGEVAHGMR